MAGFYTKHFSNHDDYMTPKSAWENIKDYLPRDKIIWECFYGDGNSGKYLEELGCNVIHKNVDFFKHNLGEVIVSNPPYSNKKRILKRLKTLDKPFIMICPSSMLQTKYFRELFGNTIQIIVPSRRLQFVKLIDGKIPHNYKSNCNFDTFYYCYKMNLKRDLIFL